MKVMIIGDTHGDASFVSNAHTLARVDEVQTVVQLGDFGFTWDRNMLASIAAWLDRDESHRWFWVDGNHDDHDTLDQLTQFGWEAPIPMHWHERLFYVPRGCVFTLGDTVCQGLGGAFSIDKAYRTQGASWWPQELITATDMERAASDAKELGPVEVMFTHDGPTSEHLETWLNEYGYKVDDTSLHNRQNLTRVVDEVRPQTLYHGHYHERYSATYTSPEGWDVQIEGVGANVRTERGRQYIDSTIREGFNCLIREF